MKPWLLNILACPIDKHHPLDTYFFEWLTTREEFEKILREAGKANRHFREGYKHLVKQILDDTISFPSIKAVVDFTESAYALDLLERAIKAGNILERKKSLGKDQLLKDYLPEIDAVYRYLNLTEIKEGLLKCNKCGRWYPIGSAVDGIPELLPDELREEKRENEWLLKWREKIPVDLD